MIELRDNNYDGFPFPTEEIKGLFPIANRSIKDLCKENQNLLVFPAESSLFRDKIEDENVLTIVQLNESNSKLQTSNIMGFIGVGNTQLKIASRFDKEDHDYLLHYMLQKVFSFNIFDLQTSFSNEDVFDFLPYLLPRYLKNALRQGLYKEYVRKEYNDSHIRGRIDVARYVSHDVPFTGNVAYSKRKYQYDNHITELIRHTLEFVKRKPYGEMVLNADSEMKKAVQQIIDATPLFSANQRKQVIDKNIRPLVHPYYSEYRPLQQLCLQILRQEELKYGSSQDEVYGILFDGAWLWEEYLNTLLKPIGFQHPENKNFKGRITLFTNNTGARYPDFYSEEMILDAKYKPFSDKIRVSEIGGEDLHQVITYMYVTQKKAGGLVFPCTKPDFTIPESKLKGYGGKMFVLGLMIPQYCESYQQYTAEIQKSESRILDYIRNLM